MIYFIVKEKVSESPVKYKERMKRIVIYKNIMESFEYLD
jgi:hypothetical protein